MVLTGAIEIIENQMNHTYSCLPRYIKVITSPQKEIISSYVLMMEKPSL